MFSSSLFHGGKLPRESNQSAYQNRAEHGGTSYQQNAGERYGANFPNDRSTPNATPTVGNSTRTNSTKALWDGWSHTSHCTNEDEQLWIMRFADNAPCPTANEATNTLVLNIPKSTLVIRSP